IWLEAAGQHAVTVGHDVRFTGGVRFVVVGDQSGAQPTATLASRCSRGGRFRSEHGIAGERIDGAEASRSRRVEADPCAFNVRHAGLLRANAIVGNAEAGDDDRDKKGMTHLRPHSALTACSSTAPRTTARARRYTDRTPHLVATRSHAVTACSA